MVKEKGNDTRMVDGFLSHLSIYDLFSEEELQEKQDIFSDAMGIASLITLPDGTPLTKPSNFCRLCSDIIRKTEKGNLNCRKSDAIIGKLHGSKPNVKPCFSGGLWDAGVNVVVRGKHLINWLVGQVRNSDLDTSAILSYADEIGADKEEFRKAYEEVPQMSRKQFESIARMLQAFVNEITEKAYNNMLLKREIKEKEIISRKLQDNEEKLKRNEQKLIEQNHQYYSLNEELNQANEDLLNTLAQLKKSEEALRQQNNMYLTINEELNQSNTELKNVNEELNLKNKQFVSLSQEAIQMNNDLRIALEKLEESNKRNENLLAAIPNMIFLFSFDGVFLDCHIPQNVKTLLPPDGFINKNIKTVLPPHIVEIHEATKKRLMETGEPQPYEYSIREEGGDKYFEGVMARYGTDRLISIVRDITKEKISENLQQEIIVTRKSAEFKQSFLANMSHEIRTPLTGMLGLAEILEQTQLDEKQHDYVMNIRQSGENLRHIINLILDYSKIEAGQIDLKPSTIASQSIFDNVRNLFQSICNKDIQLIIDVHPDFPSYIKTDFTRLQQILNNLLGNAVKFTEKGHIAIRARCVKGHSHHPDVLAKENCLLKIEIEDTGIGIDPALQNYLFKPFSQVETSQTHAMEGTGLGLSICKQLAELMGGEIGVESAPGMGSRFWFTIRAEQSAYEYIEKQSTPSAINVKRQQGLNILLVEDKKVNQMVITLMLDSIGHKVTVASNGKEGVEAYSPGQFDLVLMDIQMPVMDGVKATQILKKQHKEKMAPVVGLSANAFDSDRKKYISKGMDDYLTKPMKIDDFYKLIDRLFSPEN